MPILTNSSASIFPNTNCPSVLGQEVLPLSDWVLNPTYLRKRSTTFFFMRYYLRFKGRMEYPSASWRIRLMGKFSGGYFI
jgi:hypothetical protein